MKCILPKTFPLVGAVSFLLGLWFPLMGQKRGGEKEICLIWNQTQTFGSDSLWLNHNQLRTEVDRLINKEIESGFPFAEVTFDTVFLANKLIFKASLDSGPRVTFGAIMNHGDAPFKSGFLHRYFRIKKDQPFSLKKQKQIFRLATQMGFAQNIEAPRLEFFGNQAIIHLSLMKSRNNQFSGLIGLLPGGTSGSKSVLVGNADILLTNLFGAGVSAKIFWNRFAPNAQTALVDLQVPGLNFNGMGMQSTFELFRQDSTINRQRLEARLQFPFSHTFHYSLGVFTHQSSGIFSRTRNERTSVRLQGLSFGLSSLVPPNTQVSLFHRLCTLTGFLSQKRLTTGQNPSEQLFQAEGKFDFFWPLLTYRSRFALQSRTHLTWVESPVLSIQDQIRLGGASSIRGYLENEFFITRGGFFTLQPQFLLDSKTLVGVFGDFFVVDRGLKGQSQSPLLAGAGVGISLELSLSGGLLRLALANAVGQEQPVDIQTTKIHFGYSARF